MAKTTSRIATYEMQHAFDFFVQDCGECGVIFAVPASFNQRRRSDGQTFYCPNGHRRVYQETDATASTPPAVTLPDDWRDRIACSVRSFQNLHKHMAGQHPGYVEGPEA